MDEPRIVSGRFRLRGELGRRPGTVTWLADDTATGRPCTVKEFRLSEAPAAEAVGVFEERARTLARLSIPGIPAFIAFSCGREGLDTVCRLAQEYAPGESLALRMRRGRRFAGEEVIRWLTAAAEILAPLHRQTPPLLHRNLKPENVILGDDGALRLVDADLVGPLPADPQPLGFRLPWLASPYDAPEAAAGKATPASDLHALGLIAVAGLTGHRPPFPGGPEGIARRLGAAGVGAPLARLLGRLTDADPRQRPRHADDLLLELRALPVARRAGPRRRRLLVRLALAAAAVTLLSFWLPAVRDRPVRRTPAARAVPGGPERRAAPPPAPAPAFSVVGAVVAGRLLHDGRPVTALTDLAPRFWFRNEGTGRVQEAHATYAGGRYRVDGLPAGRIGMSVRFDLDRGNPPVYPGDLDAWTTLRVPAAGTLRADVQLRRIIRLRAPIDNNGLTPGGEEACGRGNLLRSPVTFRWDALGEGVVYAVRISRMDCRRGYRGAGTAFEDATAATEARVELPPSPEGQCYGFHLTARRGDVPVGMLTTHGTNYLAWDFRFAVPP